MPSNPTNLVNQQDVPSGASVSPEPGRAKELASYLNDHLAGTAAGCRLAERLVRTVDDPSAAGLDLEVKHDHDALRRLMDDLLGVAESRVKQATAVVAELASRAKLRLRGRPDRTTSSGCSASRRWPSGSKASSGCGDPSRRSGDRTPG